MFKAEAEGRSLPGGSSLVQNSGQSLGPGGRKLKTVDSGMDHLFEDDEDGGDGARRRRNRELGEEGDLDEQVYENDFADDEEHMEVDDNDEEAKELEVSLFTFFNTFFLATDDFSGEAKERIQNRQQTARYRC